MEIKTEHAIVMGASMGGLLAASALARHFSRVTVIERDRLPEAIDHRRGVPQGRHAHGLLVRGAEALETLFPGFAAEVEDAGGYRGDAALNGRMVFNGYLAAPATSNMRGLVGSRPLLEGIARRRLMAIGNVQLLESTQVSRLLTDAGATRVLGVAVTPDGGGLETEIQADLVVDTTGRGSRTPAWLKDLGYAPPREETVRVDIGYTTRMFRRDPATEAVAVVIAATPECPRLGALLAMEADRWMLTLAAYLGEKAPEDLDGFREFARGLVSPEIYRLIAEAEPIGEAVSTRFPASRRLRYEALKRFPEGLLVAGDAICSFNPVYGQGMSVAGWEALMLDEVLAGGTGDLARRFFKRAAKAVDVPWSIAVGNDLRIPGVDGKRSAGLRFVNWYVARLNRVAADDPVVAQAFREVVHLMAPPPSIMRPAIARRVLFGRPRRRQEREAVSAGLPSTSA